MTDPLAVCPNWASTFLWEPWAGNGPGPPGEYSLRLRRSFADAQAVALRGILHCVHDSTTGLGASFLASGLLATIIGQASRTKLFGGTVTILQQLVTYPIVERLSFLEIRTERSEGAPKAR